MVDKELLEEAYQYAMQYPLLTIDEVACKYNLCRSTFARYCAAKTPAATSEERLRKKYIVKKAAREATYKEAYAYALQHPEIPLQAIALLHNVGQANFSQYYREHAPAETQRLRHNARYAKTRQSVRDNKEKFSHAEKRVRRFKENLLRYSEEEQEHRLTEARRLEWVRGIIERRRRQVQEQRRNAAAENRERLINGQNIKER